MIYKGGGLGTSQNLASSYNNSNQLQPQNNRVTSKTAPARLEGFEDEDDDDNALFKVFSLSMSLISLTSFGWHLAC